MNRYDKIQMIIKEILKSVSPHDDWEMIDLWLAYRILALEFEQTLAQDIGPFIQEAQKRKPLKAERP